MPREWLAIRIRDALGELFDDTQFAGPPLLSCETGWPQRRDRTRC